MGRRARRISSKLRRRRNNRIKKFCAVAVFALVCFYLYPWRNTESVAANVVSQGLEVALNTAAVNPAEKIITSGNATSLDDEDADEGNKEPLVAAIAALDNHRTKPVFKACSAAINCDKGHLPYGIRALRSGVKDAMQFCIGGKHVPSFQAPTVVKMISVVVVHESTFEVENTAHFDVSVDDKEFLDFLFGCPYHRLLFVASSGNVTNKLKPETLALLSHHFHGSNDTMASLFGSIIFIGQKGLLGEHAIIKTSNYSDTDELQLTGCLQVPMGDLDVATPLPLPSPTVTRISRFSRRGFGDFERLPNCTRTKVCDGQSILVFVYSGKNKDDAPKICVNGKTIMTKGVNNGGRGLNVVLFKVRTQRITGVGHFDTYMEEDSLIENFLQEVDEGELVIAVSSDEASRFLSPTAKSAFSEFGSALIWDLKFRSSWYLVGQKGIGGFSPFEELNYASGNDWARVIDKTFCIPPILGGNSRLANSTRRRNFAKRRFCQKYDGYEDFCEAERLDEFLHPEKLQNRSLANHPIFKVPILVVAGLSQNSLRLSLETLIAQQGIDPGYVLVCYDGNYPESAALAELFHCRGKPIAASASYPVLLAKSIDVLWLEYPNATMGIVIEEELMVAPDFLSYMAQMLPVLESDETVVAVSAWNVNGFASSSGSMDLAYRTEDFPGLAFMIRKSTYEEGMKGRMDQCCFRRVWEGWNLNASAEVPFLTSYQTIIPDVSRVARRHVDGFSEIDQSAEDYFHRQRSRSSGKESWISNIPSLMTEQAYDKSLANLIDSAIPLNDTHVLAMCTNRTGMWKQLASMANSSGAKSFAVFLDDNASSQSLLRLRRCFGLFYHSSKSGVFGSGNGVEWTRRGFYKGILRFSAPLGYDMFLIRYDSSFYVNGLESNGTMVIES